MSLSTAPSCLCFQVCPVAYIGGSPQPTSSTTMSKARRMEFSARSRAHGAQPTRSKWSRLAPSCLTSYAQHTMAISRSPLAMIQTGNRILVSVYVGYLCVFRSGVLGPLLTSSSWLQSGRRMQSSEPPSMRCQAVSSDVCAGDSIEDRLNCWGSPCKHCMLQPSADRNPDLGTRNQLELLKPLKPFSASPHEQFRASEPQGLNSCFKPLSIWAN